jgi:FtsH-binding integral membrane protein
MQENINHLAPVAAGSVSDRSQFIWKVYAHVVGALLAFVGVEAYIMTSGMVDGLIVTMMNNPMITFMLFIGSGMGAQYIAHRASSVAAQYAALAAYVTVLAVIAAPAIYFAARYQPGVIDSAAGVTVLGSVGLIATAMITRKDFSFLRGIVTWGFMLAFVGIAASILFNFQLGDWFSLAMIGILGASILFKTSEIMRTYPMDRYVAASLDLFASIAIMFLYILRLMRD